MRRGLALALVMTPALLGAFGATAVGDATTPLVTATIYSSAGTSTESVSVLELQADPACPVYTGPGIEEYPRPPQQPHTVYPTPDAPGQGTWALSTILQCLPTPVSPSAVTAVSIVNSDGAPEVSGSSELTPADLASPSDFNNPSEVPIVSATGGVQYDRPWRGGSDYNFLDEVQEPAGTPVTIQVFEGPQLHVTASASKADPTTADTVTFTASLSPADENNPQYAWSFDGGASPTDQQSPQIQFSRAGTYDVAVRVTDSSGAVGTGSVMVTVNTPTGTPPTQSGGNPQSGNGQHPGGGPTGPQSSHGQTPGGGGGNPQPGGGGPRPQSGGTGGQTPGGGSGAAGPTGGKQGSRNPRLGHRRSPRGTGRRTAGAGGATGAGRQSTGAGSVSASAPIPSYPVPASAFKARARSARSGSNHRPVNSTLRSPPPRTPALRAPLVSGRLISGLVPLPLAVSPFVRTLSAPQPAAQPVREAVRTSALAAIAGGLVFILLLGLGAAREVWAGRGWRRLRVGT